MIQRLGLVCSRLSRRFVPEPFVFALLLTLLAFAMAAAYQLQRGSSWHGIGEVMLFWENGGLWQYLEFAMQMVLVLLTGHAVAVASPVLKGIRRLASWPRSPAAAVFLIAWLSMAAGFIHWGLALIVGAHFAKEVAQVFRERGTPLHYPLCGAAAYLGLMVWHGGLSGSAPLVMNTPGHFLSDQVALLPVHETLLSSMNLVLSFLLLVSLPILAGFLHPREAHSVDTTEVPPREDFAVKRSVPLNFSERLEQSDWLIGLVVVLGFACLWVGGWGRFHLSLNTLNFIFLFLGMALHRTPRNYFMALADGSRSVSGIILLFPFYAGIYGLLAYDDMIRHLLVNLISNANETVFVIGTFLSAGLINLMVPSGGGQWGIQGPLVIEGATVLNIPYWKVTMAVAYGDEWTNMLQPFWALPILQITGLKARDIVGYTALFMLCALPLYLLALLFF